MKTINSLTARLNYLEDKLKPNKSLLRVYEKRDNEKKQIAEYEIKGTKPMNLYFRF